MNDKNILDEILLNLLDEAVDKMSVKKSGSKRIASAKEKPSLQPSRGHQPIAEDLEYDGFWIEEVDADDPLLGFIRDLIGDIDDDDCGYECSECAALGETCGGCDGNCDDFDDDEMINSECFSCTNSCDDTCSCKDCENHNSGAEEICFVSIDRVIFNDPATIIIWSDGTKTIAKCESCDTFSKETGFLTCFAKKMMGNAEFHKAMHEHVYHSDAEPKVKGNEKNSSTSTEKPARSGSKRHKGRNNDAKTNKLTQDESIISLNSEETTSEPKDVEPEDATPASDEAKEDSAEEK